MLLGDLLCSTICAFNFLEYFVGLFSAFLVLLCHFDLMIITCCLEIMFSRYISLLPCLTV